MSYCVATKYNQAVFLFADTAVSSQIDNSNGNLNSFGQKESNYKGYYVQEALLKILNIRDNLVVAYASNDVNEAMEIIGTISLHFDDIGIDGILNLLVTSYGVDCSTELILAYSNSQAEPELYVFTDGKYTKTVWAEIGSGKEINHLSSDVKKIIDNAVSNDLDESLAKTIAVLQCYTYHRNLFQEGIGGIFTGVYMTQKVHFPRSLDCYVYNDVLYQHTAIISLVNMDGVFFSSSGDTIRGYSIPDMQLDVKIIKKASKALDTKTPFYFCIYSNYNNKLLFMTLNGRPHSATVSRYLRRSYNKTDYMYIFNPDVLKLVDFESDKHKSDSIPFLQNYIEVSNFNHWEFLEKLKKEDPQKGELISSFDYDFEYIEPNIDKTALRKIKKSIGYYKYLAVIDYSYFLDSLKAYYTDWSEDDNFKGDIHNIKFEKFFSFMRANVSSEFNFEDFLIIFVKKPSKRHNYIGEFDFDEYVSSFENVKLLTDNKEFYLFSYYFLKNFYLNEDYFGLEKLIYVFDETLTDDILYEAAPKFNYDTENRRPQDADIFLIREPDLATNVQTSFPYTIMSRCIFDMFGNDSSEWLSVGMDVYTVDSNESDNDSDA